LVQIAVDVRNDVIVLCPMGELTGAHHLKDLPSAVDGYLDRDYRKFVLKMSSVSMIDSTGLGVVFSVYKRVQSAHGKLVVAEIPERLTRVFEVMNFQYIMSLKDTVDEAIEELHQD